MTIHSNLIIKLLFTLAITFSAATANTGTHDDEKAPEKSLKHLQEELKNYQSEILRLKNIESMKQQESKHSIEELQRTKSEILRLSNLESKASKYGGARKKYSDKISDLYDLSRKYSNEYRDFLREMKKNTEMKKMLAVKISNIEIKIHAAKSSNFPLALGRHYFVDATGGIKKIFFGTDELGKRLSLRSEIPSTYQLDSGIYENMFLGWARYSPSTGHIYQQPSQLTVPGGWYCNAGLIGFPTNSHLKPIKLPNGKYSDTIWKVVPDSPKGHCLIAEYSRKGCKATKCLKYMYSISYITSSKESAQEIAANMQKNGSLERYADILAEIDKLNSLKKNSPGYFDRGSCGSISCAEADDIIINQQIINNF